MAIRAAQKAPSLLQIDAILARLTGSQGITEVCRFLRREFAHYSWVGVYALEGSELVLAGWDGAAESEHQRIPVGQGVCGRAARENRTVVVDDVNSDPDYLACFLDTKSEIVVPIRKDGAVLGEIDIDGRKLNAFDASDASFLGQVAARLAPGAATAPPASPGTDLA